MTLNYYKLCDDTELLGTVRWHWIVRNCAMTLNCWELCDDTELLGTVRWHWILSKTVFFNQFPHAGQLSQVVQTDPIFLNCPAGRKDKTTTPCVMKLLLSGSATLWTSPIDVTFGYVWDDLPTDICIPPLHSPCLCACLQHPLADEFTNFVNFDISPSPTLSSLTVNSAFRSSMCQHLAFLWCGCSSWWELQH